jgi:hypothetical protein
MSRVEIEHTARPLRVVIRNDGKGNDRGKLLESSLAWRALSFEGLPQPPRTDPAWRPYTAEPHL